jgi:hypothetical protein
MLLAAQAASAQIALPAGRLPGLPQLQLPAALNPQVPQAADALDPPHLRDLRHVRIADLIRAHRAVIEADPNGAPVVRSEVLVFSPEDTALERARAAGFSVARERPLEGLDARIIVLRAPEGLSTANALKQLRMLDPQGIYDFNHIYMDSGSLAARALTPEGAIQTHVAETHDAAPKLGLIDGGVNVAHAVFQSVSVHQHGCAGEPAPSAHGTAVASLMVGSSDRFHGAAPRGELYAADVYCGLPTGGAVDAVADAFSWMVREHVPVINVSLVGPPNASLENVVRLVIARGHIIVAAVGNDGPAAPPLYPASYADVVGVTAVDRRDRVLLEAARGSQVDFAAPGADMCAASGTQDFAIVRGTSFAAPIVAGLLALQLRAPDKIAADRAIADLARQATDLGVPGPDPVYGNGLVGETLRPPAGLGSTRANVRQIK